MLIDQIRVLEKLEDAKRFDLILGWLNASGLPPTIHPYRTGKNIFLPTTRNLKIAVSSHFDTVPFSPGANDNASAVVVCLELAKRHKQSPLKHLGLEIYIFDEEEDGLIGSEAFIQAYGTQGLMGLINLEMVGMGNQFALWPLHEFAKGKVLETMELTAKKQSIPIGRYDKIVMTTADHASFRAAGLSDCFTLTCISDKDVSVATHFYKAMEFDVDQKTMVDIISEAPLFEHYHQPTDTSAFLSEASLQMTVDILWETLLALDADFGKGN